MEHPEDDPKDWEIQDEQPPDKLQQKWAEEEARGREVMICRKCKKHVTADSLTCVFCGAPTFRDTGFLGKILKWLKG